MWAFQDLLVIVNDAAHCSTLVDAAVRVAHRDGARLVGVYVEEPHGIPAYAQVELATGLGARTPVGAFGTRHPEPPRDPHEWAHTVFHRRTTSAGIPAEWRVRYGDPAAIAVEHARYSDLVLLGQAEAGQAGPLVTPVLLGGGRPILVVPAVGNFPTLGERVVIAWNGSQEATRAVHDALPLLRAATDVTVLTLHGGASDGAMGMDLARHLACHGIHAEATAYSIGDGAVAALLLSRLADLQADLLVMGGYGHSRMREIVLGGVTREILQAMTVPTLLSH